MISHPYLLVNPQTIDRWSEQRKCTAEEAAPYQSLIEECNRLMDTSPIPQNLNETEWDANAWSVELDVIRVYSRNIKSLCLGFLYSRDQKYLQRAKTEVFGLCDWSSWIGKSHDKPEARGFALETGEACFAVALAYDWLYDYYTSEELVFIRKALLEKGLLPYEHAVLGPTLAWWVEVDHNWNTVCHGGAACAALALLGEYNRTQEVLDAARKHIVHFTHKLQTDGAWDEGTGYWAYGMTYLLWYGLCLRDATGDDYIFRIPGLAATGDFFVYFNPNGTGSGFSDVSSLNCKEHGHGLTLLSILAIEYDKPLYRWFKEEYCPFDPMDVLFIDELPNDSDSIQVDKLKVFDSIQWAVMTTDLMDKNQLFLSVRSGDLGSNHSHQDIHSFVLWAMGEQFLMDIDKGDYTESYFDPANRERIYPISTRAHNTVLIGGKGQLPGSRGHIVERMLDGEQTIIVADASEVYEFVSYYQRTFALRHGRYFQLNDCIRLTQPNSVQALFHTFGQAETTRSGFLIIQNGKVLELIIRNADEYKLSVTAHLLEEGPFKGRTEQVLCVATRQDIEQLELEIIMLPAIGERSGIL